MSETTMKEKAQLETSLSALDKYPGGKLSIGDFNTLFGPIAREENRKSGIPASVTLAQAALETGWGEKTIGEAKNLFGIKGTGPAGTTVASTKECANGQYYTIKAGFRKYNTWLESIEDHTKVLKLSRYANCFKYCNDPHQFAREVHKGGYATAHNYADLLISVMRTGDFYKWDVYGAKPQEAEQKEQPAEQASQVSAGNSDVSVGSKVRITGTRYATGQAIPGWVKNNTYTVSQISGNRALIKEIYSWVNLSDLSVNGSSPAQPAVAPAKKPEAPQETVQTEKPSKPAEPAKTPENATKSGTPLEGLLAQHPEVKTNQHLINLFYAMGGNNFNGASVVAQQYGVNINALCANRQGNVGDTKAAAPVNVDNTTGTTNIGNVNGNMAPSEKAQKVVNYAVSKIGSSEYKKPNMTYCQGYVADCVQKGLGVSYSRVGSAMDARKLWSVSSDISKMPVGAAFYMNSNTKNGKKYGHVGIYIGNHEVCHVTGNVVRDTISNIKNSNWCSYHSWGYEGGVNLYS